MLHNTSRWWLLVVLVAAAALRLTLALVLPYDSGPDERWRYGVAAKIYQTGSAPRFGASDTPFFVARPILGYRISAWLAHMAPDSLPLFRKLRLGAVCMTVLTVLLAYLASRNVWPSQPGRALAIATLVTVHQKFMVTGAYLNADGYTVMAVALVWYLLTVVHRQRELSWRMAAILGFALGLVFLGRENGYAAFILAVGYAWYLMLQNWKRNGRMLLVVLAVFLFFPTTFYLHQYFIYGKAFIPVIVGSGVSWVPPGMTVAQAYANFPTDGFSYPVFHLDWWQPWHWLVYFPTLFTTSFHPISFLHVDLSGFLYAGYFLFGLCGLIGLTRAAVRTARSTAAEVWSRRWLFASALMAGGALLVAVVRHSFVVLYQPDGRHLLPLLVPGMLLMFSGWRQVAKNSAIGEAVAAMGVGFFIFSGISTIEMLVPLYVG